MFTWRQTYQVETTSGSSKALLIRRLQATWTWHNRKQIIIKRLNEDTFTRTKFPTGCIRSKIIFVLSNTPALRRFISTKLLAITVYIHILPTLFINIDSTFRNYIIDTKFIYFKDGIDRLRNWYISFLITNWYRRGAEKEW